MSMQFGRWSFDGAQASPGYIAKVRTILAPYGPDAEGSYSGGDVDLLYCSFHTTRESRGEVQPHVSGSGAVMIWDGRLDNRVELLRSLNASLSADSPDVTIVSAAYEQWGTSCLQKLLGDWAVSICDPKERLLILAKDPIGTRHLYYSVEKGAVTWCTILDPLVLLAGRTFELNQEYIAGWFSSFPATHLTPYVGINSVPPSCFVRLAQGRRSVHQYWDFDPNKSIRYRTDAEYEEHFRTVFGEAIQRRLRCDAPVLAELSGGMDSSSIVCMADALLARENEVTPRLDTVSYYDDTEPNWNERPYFAKVEEKRGCIGRHIDVSVQKTFGFESARNGFMATPGHFGTGPTEASQQLEACMASQGNRVVLSGVGGDEVMGGVPTPKPELLDLMARARFRSLARQLKAWALDKRKPWFHLFFEAVREFLPQALVGVPKQRRPVSWLQPVFVRHQRTALTGYPSRVAVFGSLPSFQENVSTLNALRRQLACAALSREPLYEKRYPYLDRDLLEFIYAIPRQQVVRPGQRRSLMRRALVGIVPSEILNRKRKAFVARSPMKGIFDEWARWSELTLRLVSSSMGIVEPNFFLDTLKQAREGKEVPTVGLMRTLGVEFWLRELKERGISEGGLSTGILRSRLPQTTAGLTESTAQQELT